MKRSKYTEEQIVGILQEAKSGQTSQAEVCRKHGVSLNTFHVWKRKYSGMEQRDVRHLRELEDENVRLKPIVANQALEIDAVRALFRKTDLRPEPVTESRFLMERGVTARRACRIVGISTARPYRVPFRTKTPRSRSDSRGVAPELWGTEWQQALIKSEFASLNIKRGHRVW